MKQGAARNRHSVHNLCNPRNDDWRLVVEGVPFGLRLSQGYLHPCNPRCLYLAQIFSKLAPDAKNLVVLPGYCVIGTVGHELQQGNREVKYEKEPLKVECAVQSVSFSAHAHGNGILRLIDTMKPAHVVLVHGKDCGLSKLPAAHCDAFVSLGEPGKMQLFKQRVEKLFSIPCSDPENFSLVSLFFLLL